MQKTTLVVNPRAFSVTRTITPMNNSGIMSSALSADGKYLALGFDSGHIEIYDTSQYRLFRCLSGGGAVTTLSWHPHFPRTLAAGTKSGNLHLLKFANKLDHSDDIRQRIKLRGYITHFVWSVDGKDLAIIYGKSVALIHDSLSNARNIIKLSMNEYTIATSTGGFFGLPLELHYLDEWTLLIVFLHEIIAVNTQRPYHAFRAIDAVGDSFFGHIAISPDRSQLVSTNLRDGVDIYASSSGNWIESPNLQTVPGVDASRLYGLAYLDDRTVIVGSNGSHLVVVRDTKRTGMNRFVHRSVRLDVTERLTSIITTGCIQNKPTIVAINGDRADARVFIISVQYADPVDPDPVATEKAQDNMTMISFFIIAVILGVLYIQERAQAASYRQVLATIAAKDRA